MLPLQPNLTAPASIAANRRGELSPTQMAELREQRNLAGAIGIAGFGIALFAIAAFAANLADLDFVPETEALLTGILFGVGVPLGICGFAILELLKFRRFQRDLAERQIAEVEGEVSWQNNQYQLDYPGRPARTINPEDLWPGPYRVFTLPHSKQLLSVEALFDPTTARPAVLENLQQVWQATPETLAENRAGRLHPQQATKLSRDALSQMMGAGLLSLFIISVGRGLLGGNATAIHLVCLGVVGLSLCGALAWQPGLRLWEVAQGQVASLAGPVTKYRRTANKSAYFYYAIANLHLSVDYPAYSALLPADYRVYYLARSKQVVGLEPL